MCQFLIFLGKLFRTGLSGSYNKWMFNFIINCQTVSKSSQQQCMRLSLTHILTVTGYCQFYFIYSARCMSVTSLISTRPNSLPQWQSLRNRRTRTRPHICLDPGLHSSRICLLPLGHGCFACPQIRACFKVTILHPHDPQERPGWWQMNRAPLNSYLQRYEGASLSMFLFFFFNWGDKAINCLEHM